MLSKRFVVGFYDPLCDMIILEEKKLNPRFIRLFEILEKYVSWCIKWLLSIVYTHFIPILWLVFEVFMILISVLTPFSFLFAIRTKSEALIQYEAKK